MMIKEIHVKNYGSILDETLECSSLTALVGPNGSGKSTFLRALKLFYDANPIATIDDFYNRDCEQSIEIGLTFDNLSEDALAKFSRYIDEGKLTVTLVLSLVNGKSIARMYSCRRQNYDFIILRDPEIKAMEKRRLYDELRMKPEYSDLPSAKSADKVMIEMRNWEIRHPESLAFHRDEEQSFGFNKRVGQGYLGRFTHLIFIPAVREASDEGIEGKGSAITELMDLSVRRALGSNIELRQFMEETDREYNRIMAGESTKRNITGLEKAVDNILKTYVPTASVSFEWATEGAISISLPQADIRLVEDSYPSPVDRTGHGLQRAFILAMLQHLASVRTSSIDSDTFEEIEGGDQIIDLPATEECDSQPSLIIAIEEPELYQHPNRQRHLSNVLRRLSDESIPEVADMTQVIYATHSPLFVGIDRFDETRLIRKIKNGDGNPGITKIFQSNLDSVARDLWEACGRKDSRGNDLNVFTGHSLKSRLQCLMTPWMSESFFADVVVLVEGEGDRAAIIGAARANDFDLESMGIAVIPCGGKPSMDRPAVILKRLGIPFYIVWDGDKNDSSGIRFNHIIQRIIGVEPVDYPELLEKEYCCFPSKLEYTLREDLNPYYDSELETCKAEFGYEKREHAEKNPIVIAKVIRQAAKNGKKSQWLESIVKHIVAMRTAIG